MYKNLIRFLSILFLFLGLFSVSAQALDASLPTVIGVEYEFIGEPNLSAEGIYAHIRVREGDEYSQTKVSQSIRSLYNSQRFDLVEVRSSEVSEGEVVLTFILHAKPRIQDVIFEGNKRIKAKRLFKELGIKAGDSISELTIHQQTQKLYELYHKQGYNDVAINHSVEDTDEVSQKNLIFKIDEGSKVRISKIGFVGNRSIKGSKLRKVMLTKKWNLLSILGSGGRFIQDSFDADLELLQQYYQNEGFLDVEIPRDHVRFDYPTESKLDITIFIHEGRRYNIGNISLSGNTLFPTEKLEPLLSVKCGDIYSFTGIDASAEAIRDAYGEVGYLETFVVAQRTPNLETGAIDLEFVISESEKFYLESIQVQGNTKTKTKVILRELALVPGDIFDLKRMKSSQRRLENTQFFSENGGVSLVPEPTSIPGRKNLSIAVKEGKTGSLNFGITFSSLESIGGSIEVSQSNFDFLNYKNRFQGAGQKFRFKVAGGKKSNQIELGFEEPWLYERELAFGFDLSRSQNDYDSALYSERRIGFEPYLRKRLFELVEGRLAYNIEQVEIANVDDKAPQRVKDEAGRRIISKVKFDMARDTRDNLIFPTLGNRADLGLQFAGGYLGGQTDYLRVDFRVGQWYQVFETLQQVLLVSFKSGTVIPYNGGVVPFFDRYFLGGPQSLRGYDHRDVGPKGEKGEAVGGETMTMATVEYTIRLIDVVRFAVFYDWGFVNADHMHWGISDYRHDWGFGLRIFVMGAPLRLDLGFPLRAGKNAHEFNFSFGTTF